VAISNLTTGSRPGVCTSTTRPTAPYEGQLIYETDTNRVLIWDNSAWIVVNGGASSYQLVQTITYTSGSTFSKASYPWLRALKVKVVGGGGAGSGADATGGLGWAAGAGGVAGAYSESFITDISGLASSITVTIGAGGTGVAAANGNNGGTSSFGSLVSANGGTGAGGRVVSATTNEFLASAGNGSGSRTAVGDFVSYGGAGGPCFLSQGTYAAGGNGGDSFLSAGGSVSYVASSTTLTNAGLYGSGGSGAANGVSRSGAAGASGGDGIVIVELYS